MNELSRNNKESSTILLVISEISSYADSLEQMREIKREVKKTKNIDVDNFEGFIATMRLTEARVEYLIRTLQRFYDQDREGVNKEIAAYKDYYRKLNIKKANKENERSV